MRPFSHSLYGIISYSRAYGQRKSFYQTPFVFFSHTLLRKTKNFAILYPVVSTTLRPLLVDESTVSRKAKGRRLWAFQFIILMARAITLVNVAAGNSIGLTRVVNLGQHVVALITAWITLLLAHTFRKFVALRDGI